MSLSKIYIIQKTLTRQTVTGNSSTLCIIHTCLPLELLFQFKYETVNEEDSIMKGSFAVT